MRLVINMCMHDVHQSLVCQFDVLLQHIPYSRKIWWGIKFGDLAVYLCNHQIKICSFLFVYIRMATPYWTAKFKSANMAILGPTTKFNSCQYFQLYGRSKLLSMNTIVEVTFCLWHTNIQHHNSDCCRCMLVKYRIAGNFGEVFNLATWRIWQRSPN